MVRILIISLLLASQNSSAQDTIFWKSDYKLTWDDFRGEPDITKPDAGTYTGFRYELTYINNSFITKVHPYFLRHKSWARAKKDDTLLAHEQLRFDITELYARKLRKAFAEYNFKDKAISKAGFESITADLKRIFKKIKKDREERDARYNEETGFSSYQDKQKLWDEMIARELEDLKDYSQ